MFINEGFRWKTSAGDKWEFIEIKKLGIKLFRKRSLLDLEQEESLGDRSKNL
jgi:hypothetical protein